MSIHDKTWCYTTAEKSKRPGYLRAKFAKIRAEQAEAAKQQTKNVQQIKGRKAA